MPVAVWLYTAFIPMVVYALLGSSRVLSVSSTSTLGILAGTQIGLADRLGRELMLFNAHVAIEHYQALEAAGCIARSSAP